MDMETDRNLVLGLVAVQQGLIDPTQLAEAGARWLTQPDQPLGELLTEQGLISRADLEHLEHHLARTLAARSDSALATTLPFADGPPGSTVDFHHSDAANAETLAQVTLADPARDVHGEAETEVDRAASRQVIAHLSDPPATRNRYQVTRNFARGGIGMIWLARDRHMGREVALKELRADRLNDAMVRGRFLEEARITGQLEHPGIVPVYDLAEGAAGRRPFYTMRFVRGHTLDEAVKAHHARRTKGGDDPLEFRRLLGAFVAVCQTVAYAHSRGVIHRDLKCQNIILGDFGEVMVLDWGLAKLVDVLEEADEAPVALDGEHSRESTLAGQVLGTPAYMAPEQAKGLREQINHLTDVYGLGAILYDILAGAPPFEGASSRETLRKVREELPARPTARNAATPPALEAICLKAIAREPGERYASAADLALDVQRWLADEPVSVYRDPLSVRVTRWARRHRTQVASAGVLLVTAVVALAVSTVLIDQERQRVVQARQASERDFRVARDAVEQTLSRFVDQRLPHVPQLDALRTDVARNAAAYFEAFHAARPEDTELARQTAQVERTAANALRITNHPDEALLHYDVSLRQLHALYQADPTNFAYRDRLAETEIDVAELLRQSGRLADAEPHYQAALALAEDMRRQVSTDPRYLRTLARSLYDHAAALYESGRYDQARRESGAAVDHFRALAAMRPAVHLPTDPLELGFAAMYHGASLREHGERTVAAQSLDLAVQQAESLLKRDTNDADAQYLKALAQFHQALLAADDPARADELFAQAAAQFQHLAADFPRVALYRYRQAVVHLERGRRHLAEHALDAAAADLTAAHERLAPLHAEFPAQAVYAGELGRTRLAQAQLATAQDQPEQARPLRAEARALLDQALRTSPENPAFRAAAASLEAAP